MIKIYKILILIRNTPNQTLWEILKVTSVRYIDDPSKLPDEITGVIPKIKINQIEEFATDNLDSLQDKIKEILEKLPKENIRIFQDITYNVNIVF